MRYLVSSPKYAFFSFKLSVIFMYRVCFFFEPLIVLSFNPTYIVSCSHFRFFRFDFIPNHLQSDLFPIRIHWKTNTFIQPHPMKTSIEKKNKPNPPVCCSIHHPPLHKPTKKNDRCRQSQYQNLREDLRRSPLRRLPPTRLSRLSSSKFQPNH